MDPAQALPDADEREHLLEALAEIVEQRGFETLVRAPILLPQETFFPDPWSADASGVYRLARRLLTYAGLPDLDASVEVFSEGDVPQDDPLVRSERHEGAAAWFAGIEDGVAIYGANVSQLGDPLGVTAAMAHETAHAFRFHHGLMVDDLTTEEQLTDLTTVYLGFGLLTTKVTVRHSSWTLDGSPWASAYQRTMLGYLSPQAMAFLLAAQLRARDASPSIATDVLEANQAHYFKKALAWIDNTVDDLRARLGVPEPEHWPPPPDLAELTAPLEGELESEEAEAEEPEVLATAGDVPVLRLPYGRTTEGAFIGLIAGAGPAFAVGNYVDPAAGLGVAVLGAVVGLVRGKKWKKWECSGCGRPVARADRRCPGCDGVFVKDLDDPADRLEIDPYDLLPGRTREAAPEDPFRPIPELTAGIDPSQVDGSALVRRRGVMLFSLDLVRSTDRAVAKVERKLDVDLPAGYAKYVEVLGDGLDTATVHVFTPDEILADPDPDPDGYFVIAQSPDAELAVHPNAPGRVFLLADDAEAEDVGEELDEAIAQLVGDRPRWFCPATVVDRAALRGPAALTLDEILDPILAFGATFIEASPSLLIILSSGLGGMLRLRRSEDGSWHITVLSDRKNIDTAGRLVARLVETGFSES